MMCDNHTTVHVQGLLLLTLYGRVTILDVVFIGFNFIRRSTKKFLLQSEIYTRIVSLIDNSVFIQGV